MVIRLIIEGLILGLLLVLECAVFIRNGAHNLAKMYHKDVQDKCVEMGLITHEQIIKNMKLFRNIGILYLVPFLLISVYAVNGARGFASGFLQMFVILSIVNLVDRIFIDEIWVGHTKAWIIKGTEDMRPYINVKDRAFKWLLGTVGFAVIAAFFAGIMALILR